MWWSQEKKWGQKVNENFFRVDPRKKNPKKWKNIIFRETLFWETGAIFGKFGNFPHILQFGFCSSKQRVPEMFQTQQFSTKPVVHLRVVQLSRNFGSKSKIGIYGHLIFYLLSLWPTITAFATPQKWAEKGIFANKHALHLMKPQVSILLWVHVYWR